MKSVDDLSPILHTPGPWAVGKDTDTVLPVILAGPCIAGLTKWSGIGESNLAVVAANARLISAAPDMLAALQGVVKAWVNPHDGGEYETGEIPELDAARAAIEAAKATGQ